MLILLNNFPKYYYINHKMKKINYTISNLTRPYNSGPFTHLAFLVGDDSVRPCFKRHARKYAQVGPCRVSTY